MSIIFFIFWLDKNYNSILIQILRKYFLKKKKNFRVQIAEIFYSYIGSRNFYKRQCLLIIFAFIELMMMMMVVKSV
jgi:hypothetical protein